MCPMKRSSRNEARGGGVSGKTQFEGRTAEEAVARARKALGDSDALRYHSVLAGPRQIENERLRMDH